MDLSPRVVEPVAPPKQRNRRKWVSIGLLVLVLAGGAVVVTKFLTSALDYYCNVDEVGHKSGCEAGRSLRIQGIVAEHSVSSSNGITTFKITFNNATIPVVYDGDPGGLFQECIPVVVHGVLRGNTFDGDDVEVKHTNDYVAKNQDRIAAANAQSAACQELQHQ